MLPFTDEELQYIKQLDAEADCELLRQELPWLRDDCLRTLTIATTLLKVGLQLWDEIRPAWVVICKVLRHCGH